MGPVRGIELEVGPAERVGPVRGVELEVGPAELVGPVRGVELEMRSARPGRPVRDTEPDSRWVRWIGPVRGAGTAGLSARSRCPVLLVPDPKFPAASTAAPASDACRVTARGRNGSGAFAGIVQAPIR
ncbi:hypothetical protein Adu01nite_34980 [Paractinoplanes durhamensis]|uniref:Uncharacterized protein n=1 Tax=Paractinoplanes durhamensis TaxID=113563 RepID=A0ABQ3YX30_9ACTN|nr:hypothetical protein Adu01nite_34980 [Actinoplanes durhamensis]